MPEVRMEWPIFFIYIRSRNRQELEICPMSYQSIVDGDFLLDDVKRRSPPLIEDSLHFAFKAIFHVQLTFDPSYSKNILREFSTFVDKYSRNCSTNRFVSTM